MEFYNKGDMFNGSVNQLLSHCAKLDITEMDNQLEKQHAISYIMKEMSCTESEANEIYDELSYEEVKHTVDELVNEGLVEIVGFDKQGEPLFGLTELGKTIQKDIKKDTDKQ